MQSPSATTRAPASFVCASNDAAAGALIGAMVAFHISKAAAISAATMTTPLTASNLDLRVIHAPVLEVLIQRTGTHQAVRAVHGCDACAFHRRHHDVVRQAQPMQVVTVEQWRKGGQGGSFAND